MRIFNCLIVDDEPIAREIVNTYCSHLPSLKVVTSCSNALEAKKILEQDEVDILFLDINMPVLNGIAFLKTLKNPPQVIFTTAYREYAVDAFDLSAVDYLLKPFSFERFIVAVDKATGRMEVDRGNPVVVPQTAADQSIFIKADGKIYKVVPDEILYAEASGNYSKVITASGTIMPAMSFTVLLGMLSPPVFIRVHRSFVINKAHIRLIEGNRVFIKNFEVPIGSSFKDDFVRELGL